jgi:hypothetical protein
LKQIYHRFGALRDPLGLARDFVEALVESQALFRLGFSHVCFGLDWIK